MKTVRQFCIALLIVMAIAAFIGGYMLISDPSGRSLQLYDSAPFKDFSPHGWILIVIFGLGGIISAVVTRQRNRAYPFFIMAEGVLLLLWLITGFILFQQIQFFQVIFGLLAIALLLLGNLIRKDLQNKEYQHPSYAETGVGENVHKKSHYHKHRRRGH
jgi:hypothetical protein